MKQPMAGQHRLLLSSEIWHILTDWTLLSVMTLDMELVEEMVDTEGQRKRVILEGLQKLVTVEIN